MKTLIQIHYHDRIGGVAKVMAQYAETFRAIVGQAHAVNVTLCHSSDPATSPFFHWGIRSIDECEYRDFSTVSQYHACRARLISRMAPIILECSRCGPVLVIGHNLSLGKNCALSSAFAALASGHPGIRFFSVIHDFAEEGRLDRLRQIDRLASRGVHVWKDLYPAAGTVRYVTLSERNVGLLKKAGLPARLMINPVGAGGDTSSLEVSHRKALSRGLRILAENDGVPFDASGNCILYPVRFIGRKNILEAVLIACGTLNATLLVGGPGSSSLNVKQMNELRSLCVQRKIPAIFDVNRVVPLLPSRLQQEPLYPLLTRYCEACITTAVAEGFGYAFFEPWLYGVPVIGRMPDDFVVPSGMDLSFLYQSLRVQVSSSEKWRIVNKYQHALCVQQGLFAKKNSTVGRQLFDEEDCIDFGLLDWPSQLRFVNNVFAGKAAPVMNQQTRENLHWVFDHNRLRTNRVAVNRASVEHCFGISPFQTAFKETYLTYWKIHPKARRMIGHVRKKLSSIGRFRLLLSPED